MSLFKILRTRFRSRFVNRATVKHCNDYNMARISELESQVSELEDELKNVVKRNISLSADLADSAKDVFERQAVIDAIYTEAETFMASAVTPIEGYNRMSALQAKQSEARDKRKAYAIAVHDLEKQAVKFRDLEKEVEQRRADAIKKQTKWFNPVIEDFTERDARQASGQYVVAIGAEAGRVNECCIEPPAAEHIEEARQRLAKGGFVMSPTSDEGQRD